MATFTCETKGDLSWITCTIAAPGAVVKLGFVATVEEIPAFLDDGAELVDDEGIVNGTEAKMVLSEGALTYTFETSESDQPSISIEFERDSPGVAALLLELEKARAAL